MAASEQLRDKLSQIPHRPGVYLHKDRFGTVLYVGKARDLRKRVSQYFHPSRRMGWDLKFNALVDAIHDVDWHVVKSEAEALLLEGRLIKDFKPRFNIDFRDDKGFLLLKVNLNDPIPRFTLTRLRKDDGSEYFGPFAHSGSVRRALTMMRRKFKLRGCRPLTPTESDYRHCLYGNLKNCTAPCIGNVPRGDYLGQVRAGIDFLRGCTDELQVELEAEMKKAAANLEFEKAAQLRDALEDMRRATQKTEKFERIPYKLPVAIHPESDLRELARVLDLPGPPSRIEGFDISNISGTFMVASMVSFWHGRPDRANYRRFRMQTVTEQNDFACMAETIRRRYSRLSKEVEAGRPLARDADGGEAGPGELQRAIDDVSRVARGATPGPTTDAASGGDAGGLGAPWVPRPPADPRLPDLILIDGGKGQVAQARSALVELGLNDVSVVGVAKGPERKPGLEELIVEGEGVVVTLPPQHPGLHLIQQIRDEAHRFAIVGHRARRGKTRTTSELNEIPGIGDKRRRSLLAHFGGLKGVQSAAIEDIMKVEGISRATAQKIYRHLHGEAEQKPRTG